MDKTSAIICYLSILLSSWLVGGCTINIHREQLSAVSPVEASGSMSSSLDENLLIAPQRPAHLADSQNKVSAHANENVKDGYVLAEKIITMHASGSGKDDAIELLDNVELDIVVQVDAYLNCYYQNADSAIVKIFPNRYSTLYRVYDGQRIALPDNNRYGFVADSHDFPEGFLCVVSSEDILSRLPANYRANVFQTLPVRNFDALFELYQKRSSENLVGRSMFYVIE